MFAFTLLATTSAIVPRFDGIDYTQCGNTPECMAYHDGCNDCTCPVTELPSITKTKSTTKMKATAEMKQEKRTKGRKLMSSHCETGGCSGQICSEGASGLITTCEFRCEYGCNQFRTCGLDKYGNCGWMTDDEVQYKQCIANCDSGTFPLPPFTAGGCTEKACFVQGTPVCNECEKGTYWLTFDTYPGTPTCKSRYLRIAQIAAKNSRCGCPSSHPYFERGVGCIDEKGCDSLNDGNKVMKRNIFMMKTPKRQSKCPYKYKLCKSDKECDDDDNLVCSIPDDDDKSCIPLMGKFDNKCHLVSNCKGCIPDCMGSGIGYCQPRNFKPHRPQIMPGQTPPTKPPICNLVRCANPTDDPCPAEKKCNGCSPTLPFPVQCKPTKCKGDKMDIDKCCGGNQCAQFSVNGRDVTKQCTEGTPTSIIQCLCPAVKGEEYCCNKKTYNSLCEIGCESCLDPSDCTKGPCQKPMKMKKSMD